MGAKLAGGGGGKRGQLDVNAEPNIVPFVDVMLVLLIIFMVASPVASRLQGPAVEAATKAYLCHDSGQGRPSWLLRGQ